MKEIKTVECSSLFGIKVNDSIEKISAVSDLFEKELLPPYTSESEY